MYLNLAARHRFRTKIVKRGSVALFIGLKRLKRKILEGRQFYTGGKRTTSYKGGQQGMTHGMTEMISFKHANQRIPCINFSYQGFFGELISCVRACVRACVRLYWK